MLRKACSSPVVVISLLASSVAIEEELVFLLEPIYPTYSLELGHKKDFAWWLDNTNILQGVLIWKHQRKVGAHTWEDRSFQGWDLGFSTFTHQCYGNASSLVCTASISEQSSRTLGGSHEQQHDHAGFHQQARGDGVLGPVPAVQMPE